MKLIFITTCITLSLLVSCTKKELPPKKEEVVNQPVITVNTPVKDNPDAEKAYAKMLAANLRFIGSLEKEVLKLLLQGSSPDVNQFEVLTFGFDKFNGAKTGFLQGFGCQKIAVKPAPKKFEVYSECTKPAKKLAEISEDLGNKNRLTVVFLTSNWKVILGNAAGINPERICEFTLKDNKVQTFDCKETVFSPRITGLDINLLELKIRKYTFNRNQSEELVVEGGQYKDLVENKKINMTVPMTGKISIVEKELKVKDDFADMQNKLLGVEEQKQDKKDEEVSGKKENITPHTAEPEYIQAGEEGQIKSEEEREQEREARAHRGQKGASSTAQVEEGENQNIDQQQEQSTEQGTEQGTGPQQPPPPADADPNLPVPTTPPQQQPYGR